MALRSTVFKAQLQLADVDHGCYGDHALTLTRHPSETDERMMVRLVALALQAHQVQDLCDGDGTIGFGAGLCDPDDPDVLLTDFTGRKRLWVEVGQPEDKPLARARSQADAVVVYAYAPSADVWWRGIAGKVARLPRLAVWRRATKFKPVVPLLIDPLKPEKSLPSVMAERQWLDLRSSAGDGAFDKLFRDLAALDLDDRPGGTWNHGKAPYPGLLAFDVADAPIFFGRGKETRQIVEQLNANQRRDACRMLTVLGGSGSGKSSLVRAGVVPRLQSDSRWRVIDPFRPGRQPMEQLAIRLVHAYGLAATLWMNCSQSSSAPRWPT